MVRKRSGLKGDQIKVHFTAIAYLKQRYTSHNGVLIEKDTDKLITVKRVWVPAIDGQPRFQISTSVVESIVRQLEESPLWKPYLDPDGCVLFDVHPPFHKPVFTPEEIPELSETNQRRLFELIVSLSVFGTRAIPASVVEGILGITLTKDTYDLLGLTDALKNKWTSHAIKRIVRWSELLFDKKNFRNNEERRATLIKKFCPGFTQERVDADNKEFDWMQSLLSEHRKCSYYIQDGEVVCLPPFWDWCKFIKLDAHGRIFPNRPDGSVWFDE
jgi:hypothetical protein